MGKVVSWNVNSIRSRLHRVLPFLEKEDPDIVLLQELKCEEANFPYEDFEKKGYYCYVKGQKTYNGVAVLSKNKADQVFNHFGDALLDDTARLIGVQIAGVIYFSVYVPNGQEVGSDKFAYKLAWLQSLCHIMSSFLHVTDRVLMGGDFNIAHKDLDVHDPKLWEGRILFSQEERNMFDQILQLGFVDCFRYLHPEEQSFSWWDYRQLAFPHNKGLRIDYILMSHKLAAKCRECLIIREERKGPKPSDHAPVMAQINN